ncbi:MAG: AMP-binding protein [Methylococcaceae bacterium]|nr:AMP-binding protein [Methylococcaceae bacterium]
MNPILAKITQLEKNNPDKTAIIGSTYQLSYRELKTAIGDTADMLINQCQGVIGLLMDNSPAWAVIDLACQASQTPLVPLPPFYTDEQIQHVIEDSGLQWVLTDNPSRFSHYKTTHLVGIASDTIAFVFIGAKTKQLLPGTSKITYTSGTTGQPKGICLTEESLLSVSQSLIDRSQATSADIHLALTPLAVLLENIASVYTCILAGCTSCIPSLAESGLTGSSGLDSKKQFAALDKYKATSAIIMPQMLQAMILSCTSGLPIPESLRFLSVGGATVNQSLLLRAKDCGLPVFQGYGLSECASVVSLNSLEENKIGSVGKVLPHLQVIISDDSEVLIKGPIFNGYLNKQAHALNTYLPTGDLGFIDDDNYLYISGRKKNQFITSFGRNVSPEWVEDILTTIPDINQAFIYGEARPWNTAILFPTIDTKLSRSQTISLAVNLINETLPDYAQIRKWIDAGDANSSHNQKLTRSGVLCREQIFKAYKNQIDSLYETEIFS